MICESMYTVHIVTDEDGSLKIKQVDEFNDSKVFVEMNQAIVARRRLRQRRRKASVSRSSALYVLVDGRT